MMMGHLGDRVSALLDGQLGPDEEERAWSHVHVCHLCRDLVEREGWVKTRLAGLGFGDPATPDTLKGSLLRSGPHDPSTSGAPTGQGSSAPAWATWTAPPGEMVLAMAGTPRPRRALGIAALGGGAVGAAMMGVLALGAAPADAPTLDRRVPATSIAPQGPVQLVGPQRRSSVP